MSEDESIEEKRAKTASKVSSFAIGNYIKPISLLKDTLEKHDWFKGLIMSTTFLEMFGFLTLQTYYEQKVNREHHKKIGKFFHRIGLERIITLLYFSGLIKRDTYTKMIEINKARNKLVHHVRRINDNEFAFEDKIDGNFEKKAIKQIKSAIKCLEELGIAH